MEILVNQMMKIVMTDVLTRPFGEPWNWNPWPWINSSWWNLLYFATGLFIGMISMLRVLLRVLRVLQVVWCWLYLLRTKWKIRILNHKERRIRKQAMDISKLHSLSGKPLSHRMTPQHGSDIEEKRSSYTSSYPHKSHGRGMDTLLPEALIGLLYTFTPFVDQVALATSNWRMRLVTRTNHMRWHRSHVTDLRVWQSHHSSASHVYFSHDQKPLTWLLNKEIQTQLTMFQCALQHTEYPIRVRRTVLPLRVLFSANPWVHRWISLVDEIHVVASRTYGGLYNLLEMDVRLLSETPDTKRTAFLSKIKHFGVLVSSVHMERNTPTTSFESSIIAFWSRLTHLESLHAGFHCSTDIPPVLSILSSLPASLTHLSLDVPWGAHSVSLLDSLKCLRNTTRLRLCQLEMGPVSVSELEHILIYMFCIRPPPTKETAHVEAKCNSVEVEKDNHGSHVVFSRLHTLCVKPFRTLVPAEFAPTDAACGLVDLSSVLFPSSLTNLSLPIGAYELKGDLPPHLQTLEWNAAPRQVVPLVVPASHAPASLTKYSIRINEPMVNEPMDPMVTGYLFRRSLSPLVPLAQLLRLHVERVTLHCLDFSLLTSLVELGLIGCQLCVHTSPFGDCIDATDYAHSSLPYARVEPVHVVVTTSTSPTSSPVATCSFASTFSSSCSSSSTSTCNMDTLSITPPKTSLTRYCFLPSLITLTLIRCHTAVHQFMFYHLQHHTKIRKLIHHFTAIQNKWESIQPTWFSRLSTLRSLTIDEFLSARPSSDVPGLRRAIRNATQIHFLTIRVIFADDSYSHLYDRGLSPAPPPDRTWNTEETNVDRIWSCTCLSILPEIVGDAFPSSLHITILIENQFMVMPWFYQRCRDVVQRLRHLHYTVDYQTDAFSDSSFFTHADVHL